MNWSGAIIFAYVVTMIIWVLFSVRQAWREVQKKIQPGMSRQQRRQIADEAIGPADRIHRRFVVPGFVVTMVVLFIGSAMGWWK